MSSDESDDEPLSNLAEAKKLNPTAFSDLKEDVDQLKPSKKSSKHKKLTLTIKRNDKGNHSVTFPSVERPLDVWLYLKDLNPAGPYSCLLCTEWFINRYKMIFHYVVDHGKDFCGICRYFVPDRESWLSHMKFHTPWQCSLCVETFLTDGELRQHFTEIHKLVHCRLCNYQVTDDDEYNCHLFRKHNVANVSNKDCHTPWEIDNEDPLKFFCLFCSKPNMLCTDYVNHFMCIHNITLRCFAQMVSGTETPFTVLGAIVSAGFKETHLAGAGRFGYVDLDQTPFKSDPATEVRKIIKKYSTINLKFKQEEATEVDESGKGTIKDAPVENEENDITDTYKGTVDFDTTLMEVIAFQGNYFDYVSKQINSIESKVMPEVSEIDYEGVKSDIFQELHCPLCSNFYKVRTDFISHLNKMHGVKTVPIFSCRVCTNTFETHNELTTHIDVELGDFQDLWLCQFCEKEFDNREETRRHLSDHWDVIEKDNCFSPHLGFKCRYCPTLFWNETDREVHHRKAHLRSNKLDNYLCGPCSKQFSDKVWFLHHFLSRHCEEDTTKRPDYLLKCLICCLVLSSMDEIRNHFRMQHREATKIFCSLGNCNFRPFAHRKSFRLHLKTLHGKNSEKRSVCEICARQFTTLRALTLHVTRLHGTKSKIRCKLCDEPMQSKDERKLHYMLSHPGEHPFECAECGSTFQYKSTLYLHRASKHSTKNCYRCSTCSKVFNKRDSLREHELIHEGPRHACSYCPMRFVQRSNMVRHERRHTGERPYSCPHCARTFADKGACSSHLKTHNRSVRFSCDYCGQTFAQKSKLTYHTRKHTGENLETCGICSKQYTSGCALREHMKTHDKKNTIFKCPVCKSKYRDQRSVARHMKSSHKATKLVCPLCSKTYTSSEEYRNHVITHGRRNAYQCKRCPKTYPIRRSMIRHIHSYHGNEAKGKNLKWYYKSLDPRECDLDLDEETITKIFGAYRSNLRFNFEKVSEDEDKDDDGKELHEIEEVRIKEEPNSESEPELEPTDFVSVKIEPIDEAESSGGEEIS